MHRENCIRFKTGKCGLCQKVCGPGAVDFEQQDALIVEPVGAIVVSTGFDLYTIDEKPKGSLINWSQKEGMKPPKVYIDTNVLKFSATQLPRLMPRQTTINWGGRIHDVMVHDFVEVNPNETITNQNLKNEAQLLQGLAELGKSGKVRYVIQMETLLESWGIPNMDSSSGRFYGSPYEPVDAPIQYGRVVFGGGGDTQKMQFEFLCGIRSQRFLELQKMTGAYQGEGKINRNQLLDAFHLWCAEHNGCDYFLSLDFKLIKVLQQNQKKTLKIRPVCPSELLREVQEST